MTRGQVVAIDGKKLRRSYDNKSNKAAVHVVSAWASANHVVLGQVKTEEKSNEIQAVPELFNLLKQEKIELGIKVKRLKAGWDNAFLGKILAGL